MPKVFLVVEKVKKRYRESTLRSFVRTLATLNRNCDIDNPDGVYEYCSKLPKASLIYWSFYKIYAKVSGLTLPEVNFDKSRSIPYVPTEEMLNLVTHKTKLEKSRKAIIILKNTGVRIGELSSVRFDIARKICIVVCEKKRGVRKERIIPVKEEVCCLAEYETDPKRLRKSLRNTVKILAKTTGNPDFLKVHIHTFRHFFATEVYAKTGDLMLVKELLGHEDIRETQIYVHIVKMSNPKKEAVKIDVKDSERMLELVKAGWKVGVQTDEFIIFEKPSFP